ncbi:hypothetical protein LOTGIDRAFT_176364 [Lottia gigantea]|uniref:EGF-like domain-containing protein n=1 Tax=Lottia gigantea TaxID=225164 RepID=V4CP01_LOTGI|nr:hypothetical protein LOTGIDRAFT_176364 [Lottia gigantea]ESP04140.1 hypothetical protein LOTGIDRAFT_176364 [Lottia gigantea]
MNNLLCSALLISVMLILTDAGCLTYPNITDANFDKDCNGNVVITCNEGFKMVQGLECVEEEWRYQNPICKRTVIIPDCKNGRILTAENGTLKCNCPLNTFGDDCKCRYKYSNVTDLDPFAYEGISVSDSAECDENCANDTRCSAATITGGTCLSIMHVASLLYFATNDI